MKYYSENDIRELIDEADYLFARSTPINVQSCNDCPMFECDGIQPIPGITRGWCRKFSDDDPPPGMYVHHIRVTNKDFCNKDHIGEVDV